MSNNTVGIISTAEKHFWPIVKRLEETINNLVLERRLAKDERRQMSVQGHLNPSSGMVTFNFTYDGDDRILYVFFDCDKDYEYWVPGAKLTLLLGEWGASETLMKLFVMRLADLLNAQGYVYSELGNCEKFRTKQTKKTC